MTMKRRSHFRIAIALAGVAVVALVTAAKGSELHRLVAAHQRVGETSTPVTAGAGGTLVYTTTFFNAGEMTYVTFNAQADTHSGAALLMKCELDGVACELGFGAANPTPVPTPWSTLTKLPTGSGNTNCSDGGGGSADCHDQTIHKTWCMQTVPGVHTVDLYLASDTGGTVFYERSHIYIDASLHADHGLECNAPGVFP